MADASLNKQAGGYGSGRSPGRRWGGGAAWTTADNCCYDPAKMTETLMSWLPSNDPVLGDPKSCDALELVIVPRTRDLGDGFEVRRALPPGKRQMIGPFISFHPSIPPQSVSATAMPRPPHPHIGLPTA